MAAAAGGGKPHLHLRRGRGSETGRLRPAGGGPGMGDPGSPNLGEPAGSRGRTRESQFPQAAASAPPPGRGQRVPPPYWDSGLPAPPPGSLEATDPGRWRHRLPSPQPRYTHISVLGFPPLPRGDGGVPTPAGSARSRCPRSSTEGAALASLRSHRRVRYPRGPSAQEGDTDGGASDTSTPDAAPQSATSAGPASLSARKPCSGTSGRQSAQLCALPLLSVAHSSAAAVRRCHGDVMQAGGREAPGDVCAPHSLSPAASQFLPILEESRSPSADARALAPFKGNRRSGGSSRARELPPPPAASPNPGWGPGNPWATCPSTLAPSTPMEKIPRGERRSCPNPSTLVSPSP
ncbi:skin secretory protein xP2-like [Loxodonta africana]|uniref:skin secretory protein xP2-like n=1 Tax=Loxodonta africana TaxID=9785 RepID=UPI0005406510|nr:skin secretory protein xP2-like [Loxodonta africana]